MVSRARENDTAQIELCLGVTLTGTCLLARVCRCVHRPQ